MPQRIEVMNSELYRRAWLAILATFLADGHLPPLSVPSYLATIALSLALILNSEALLNTVRNSLADFQHRARGKQGLLTIILYLLMGMVIFFELLARFGVEAFSNWIFLALAICFSVYTFHRYAADKRNHDHLMRTDAEYLNRNIYIQNLLISLSPCALARVAAFISAGTMANGDSTGALCQYSLALLIFLSAYPAAKQTQTRENAGRL